jgi:hypothetical protein
MLGGTTDIQGVGMVDQPFRSRRIHRYMLWLVAALLPVLAVPAFASSASAAISCTAEYRKVIDWGPPDTAESGFQGEMTVTNRGTARSIAWFVAMVLPEGVTIEAAWNATLVPDTVSEYRNMSFNGVVGPGRSITFGFIASRPGVDTPPRPVSQSCRMVAEPR